MPASLPLRGSYDMRGAAEYLSISVSTLHRLIADGYLVAHQPEGMTHRRVARADLDAYINRSRGAQVIDLRGVAS